MPSPATTKTTRNGLPMILLGLRAQPQLDSGLSPLQQAFGTKLNLPADLASREGKELDRVDFYKQLQKVRDRYTYPPAMHHKQDDSKSSDALKKAKFMLVRQDRHNPPLAEAYRGPYKVKSQIAISYVLSRGSHSEDRVAINCLIPCARRR